MKRIEGSVMRLIRGATEARWAWVWPGPAAGDIITVGAYCDDGPGDGRLSHCRGRACFGRSNMVSGTRKKVVMLARPVRPAPTQNCLIQPSSLAMYPPVMPPTTEPLARDAV